MVKPSWVQQTYGRLTVRDYLPSKIEDGRRVPAKMKVSCSCGSELTVSAANLKLGKCKSCGCIKNELLRKHYQEFVEKRRAKADYKPIEASARDLFQNYLVRHFGNLSFEHFYELTQKHCYYCHSEPSQYYNKFKYGKATRKYASEIQKNEGTFTYNGLDRIDSKRGYDVDNVVACCKICNYMKHVLSTDEFFNHIARIIRANPEPFRLKGLL